jgi:hypothetical protein
MKWPQRPYEGGAASFAAWHCVPYTFAWRRAATIQPNMPSYVAFLTSQ